MELIGIESEYLSMLQENLNISVNGRDFRDIQGMKIAAGEQMFIKTYRVSPENPKESIRNLKIRPKLRYMNENGEEASARIYVGEYRRQHYEFLEVIQYFQRKWKI